MSLDAVPKVGVTPHPTTGPRRLEVLRAAMHYNQSRIGIGVLAVVFFLMVFGPMLATNSPTEFVATPGMPPGPGAWFGTDSLGRDVLSRFLHGGRTVLWVSVASAVLGELLGLAVGLLAGTGRRWADEVLMRGSDVVLAFPQIVLALLFVSWFGPNLLLIVLIVAVGHAPRVARLVRATTREVVQQDYVKAAEVQGIPRRQIILRDVLPNLSTPLLVDFGLRLIWSIGIIASLSFIGLGIQPPTADWGLMINENRGLLAAQPWAVLLPTIGISLYAVGVNLLTEGLGRAVAGIDRSAI